MSNNRMSRSYNTSPLPGTEELLQFLEPTPRPDTSAFNTFSTRDYSPKFIANPKKSNKASPLPVSSNIKAKLELTKKSNAMLVERNRALVKEKASLQRKMSREPSNPRDVFKEQVVALTKETYAIKIANKSRVWEIEEKVKSIRKILKWIRDQSGETEIKFIKSGICEIIEKLHGFEIEIEASIEGGLKKEERNAGGTGKNVPYDSKETISILLKKNTELSKNISNLEKKIEDQTVILT